MLFGPGQLLDAARYFIILPDNIGHGKSSKPSDGLHAKFPHYDYDDMVKAQHELVEKGLGVNHLRLIMGTSMGCMHAWVWGETYPDFMDAHDAAGLPAGADRRPQPDVAQDGDRRHSSRIRTGRAASTRRSRGRACRPQRPARSSPAARRILLQKDYPTPEAADKYLGVAEKHYSDLDANDLLYAVSSSRNYDPSAQLGKITVPVMWVNSADDFINPPELGIAQAEDQRSEERTVRTDSGVGPDAWPRHPHLGRAVAAISKAVAGRIAALTLSTAES